MIAVKSLAVALATLVAISPHAASACWIPPPPSPPSIGPDETQQAYATRLADWKRNQDEFKQRDAEEQVEREKRREAGLWEVASQIVVVEVIAAGLVKPKDLRDRWAGMPQVTVRVTQIVQGRAITRPPFKLRYEDAQWCLMGPAAEVVRGQVGDKFVVFAEKGELGMKTVIGGYGVQNARDNRTRQLLEMPLVPQSRGDVCRLRGRSLGKNC
jgi:hypothetical protein